MVHLLSRPILKTLVLLLLIPALAGCGKAVPGSTSIGVLSAVSTQLAPAASAAKIGLEQSRGYDTGFKAANIPFKPEKIDESISQSDIQRTIRDMVEDPKAPIVAVLGATSNNATSHAASLVNFFNLPMVIPSANGDNLYPSSNLWAFRLSAPGAAYANYLFGSVITTQTITAMNVVPSIITGVKPEFTVAILYEENTFGESAAVATASAVLKQTVKIGVYSTFPPDNTNPTVYQTLANKVKDSGAQLVYIITSDSGVAKGLMQSFVTVFSKQNMPIMVGQAGGFAATDFLSAPEADGVYILRQKIDPTSCPPGIKSIYDAQSYAAVYLLDHAFQQANANLAALPKQFSFSLPSGPTPAQQREAIRDVLKASSLDLPCLGKVAFDNSGQNKLLNLELVVDRNGQTAASSSGEFMALLQQRLATDPLQ